LAIRVIGGSIGYSIYYNVFLNKFTGFAITSIGGTLVKLGIKDPKAIEAVIGLTGAGLLEEIKTVLPPLAANETAFQAVVYAGQMAYAEAYKYVYYVSIAFGGISIIAACFLGDINQFMDDHVAVVMH
jgi:hypothetical protein